MINIVTMKNDLRKWLASRLIGNKEYVVEIACKSTDTKPTNFSNGSTAIEVDTGDFYIFDEAEGVWNKMCSIKEE